MPDRAGALDRLRCRAWGLSGRLTASYILVTLAAVVLVEMLALGFQVLPLLISNQLQPQLQAQANATATSWGQRLAHRYPGGVPAGAVVGDPGQNAQPGRASAFPDGTLIVPEITGPIHSNQAVTAVVVIAANGTVVASSAPSRYPPGRAAASELPNQAVQAIAPPHGTKDGWATTPYGKVIVSIVGPGGTVDIDSAPGRGAALTVRVPVP